MWIPDTKSGIFGSLELGKSSIENAKDAIQNILKTGEKRLRKSDIERARKYIKAIEPNIRAFKTALKEFDAIAS